jgi:hypothetical protein
MLLNADAPDEAERAMDALRADAEQIALPDLIAGALCQQAEIAYQRGDLTRCEMDARAAIEAGGDFASRLATPWQVMVLAEQGRLAEAERMLESAGMLGPLPENFLWTAALGSRGRLRLAQGDARAAAEDFADARDRSARGFPKQVEPPWRPLLAEALVLLGGRSEAAAEADAYAALAREWGTRRARGHAARMRGARTRRACARWSRRARKRSRSSRRPAITSPPATLGWSSRVVLPSSARTGAPPGIDGRRARSCAKRTTPPTPAAPARCASAPAPSCCWRAAGRGPLPVSVPAR